MNKYKIADLLFITLSLPTVALGLFVFGNIANSYSKNYPDPYKVECKTKNGVPVSVSGRRYCLKPEIFVMKPEGF